MCFLLKYIICTLHLCTPAVQMVLAAQLFFLRVHRPHPRKPKYLFGVGNPVITIWTVLPC